MATCLLVIDVQNGFINQHTRHVPALVEAAQHDYDFLIATQFFNAPGSLYRQLIFWNKMDRNSQDFNLAFKPRSDVLIIEKQIYSCVNPQFLDFLKTRGIQTIHLCGIDTDICVTKCAVDLIENGIIPRVLSSLCASTAGKDHHHSAIRTLHRFIGAGQVE